MLVQLKLEKRFAGFAVLLLSVAIIVAGVLQSRVIAAGRAPLVAASPGPEIENAAAAQVARILSEENLFKSEIKDRDIDYALEDRDARISPDFAVPPGMESRVRFWLSIYGRYTSYERVLFDARHPEVIYEVLDYRPVAGKTRSWGGFESEMRRDLSKRERAYRDAFRRLAKNPKPANPTELEDRIIKAVALSPHPHSFREWGRSFRSQTGQRDYIARGVAENGALLARMEHIFREAGLPFELSRLALVESSLNTKAHSRVGAAGIWQFMRESGRMYLKIALMDGIDERLSPVKASMAAARLLEANQKRLHSWPLSVTAYNHGFTHLPKLKGNRDLADAGAALSSCPSRHKMGFASSNFYAEFLAALRAERYADRFFGEVPIIPEPKLNLVSVQPGESLVAVSDRLGVQIKTLTAFNPDISGSRPVDRALPAGYRILAPNLQPLAGEGDSFDVASFHGTGRPWKKIASRRSKRSSRGVRLVSDKLVSEKNQPVLERKDPRNDPPVLAKPAARAQL